MFSTDDDVFSAFLSGSDSGESSNSVEMELLRLEEAMAAHDRELACLEACATTSMAPDNAAAEEPKASLAAAKKKPGRRGSDPYSSQEWRARAFPGLAERRWLQLLVDESVAVWADPVTLRQFMPTVDVLSGELTGDFVEIDIDHPYFIEVASLQEAIKEHRAGCVAAAAQRACPDSPSASSASESTSNAPLSPCLKWALSLARSCAQEVNSVQGGRVVKKTSRRVNRSLVL